MEKVLIFTTRQMCYDSAGFFAKKLAMNLEELGVECELCMFAEEDIPGRATFLLTPDGGDMEIGAETERLLSRHIGRSYLAVIDFNSRLPRVALDDGTLFLDSIDAPFVNYILDHPLYQHSMLASPLRDYYVATPDGNHAAYVRKYYPNIKGAFMQPLAAAEVRNVPRWAEAEDCVLFIGTYRSPQEYLDQLHGREDKPGLPTRQDLLEVIEELFASPAMTVEQSLGRICKERYGFLPEEDPQRFRLWMNNAYLSEVYFRNQARTQAVEALAEAGLPVRVIGDCWEEHPLAKRGRLVAEDSVEFAGSYRRIAECKVLLNSSPFFRGGIHDRIPAAMANRTLLLTDDNPYLREHFADKDCLLTYPPAEDGALVALAEEALHDKARGREMTERAYEIYRNNYTWRHFAQDMLACIRGIRTEETT